MISLCVLWPSKAKEKDLGPDTPPRSPPPPPVSYSRLCSSVERAGHIYSSGGRSSDFALTTSPRVMAAPAMNPWTMSMLARGGPELTNSLFARLVTFSPCLQFPPVISGSHTFQICTFIKIAQSFLVEQIFFFPMNYSDLGVEC